MATLLDIRGLTVRFATRGGAFTAVDGIDLQVDTDEVLAIVGESGSGKSVAMLAIMGLLPWTATVSAERLVFAGQDLRALSARQRRGLIGRSKNCRILSGSQGSRPRSSCASQCRVRLTAKRLRVCCMRPRAKYSSSNSKEKMGRRCWNSRWRK